MHSIHACTVRLVRLCSHLTRLPRSTIRPKNNPRRTTSTTPIPTISAAHHSKHHTVRSGKPCLFQSSNPGTRQNVKVSIFPISPLNTFFSVWLIHTQPTGIEQTTAPCAVHAHSPHPVERCGYGECTPNDLNCSQCHSSGCSMPKRFPA